MKNLLYFAALIWLLASCKSNTRTTVIDSTKTTITSTSTQSLIKEFIPIIQGGWVKADYIEKVIKTKSPEAASDLAVDLTVLNIETTLLQGDSIVTNAGWGNHEGSDLVLKFRPGKNAHTIVLGDFDLGYTVEKKDTCLLITHFDERKKTTLVTRYIRALHNPTLNLGDGMDYLINKSIIAGKYIAIDSTGISSKVTFTDKGKVNGLDSFNGYSILNDLNSDPMTNLDEIFFSVSSNQVKSYTFKISADTLKLYDILANADSTEELVGKLKYKLIKQK